MIIKILFKKFILFSIIFSILTPKQSIAENISIYQAQEKVLINIVKYSNFNNRHKINYCLYAKTPLYSLLYKQNNIKVILKNFNDDIYDCNVIFIDKSYQHNFLQILPKTRDKPILTISNSNNFIKNGGIIEFKIQSSKILLNVNLKSLKKSSIFLHKKLLSVSKTY